MRMKILAVAAALVPLAEIASAQRLSDVTGRSGRHAPDIGSSHRHAHQAPITWRRRSCGLRCDTWSIASQSRRAEPAWLYRGQRYCGSWLHLRPANRYELRDHVRICHRQTLWTVQGTVQHHREHSQRVHLQGHGGRHTKQRHALFLVVAGPARRTNGYLGPCNRPAALLLGPALRRKHLQLRLYRYARHRQRGRRLHGGWTRLERADPIGRQEGVPFRYAAGDRDIPYATLWSN